MYDAIVDTAKVWLVQSVIPVDHGTRFLCQGIKSTDGGDAPSFELSFAPASIIRDADLPQVELP